MHAKTQAHMGKPTKQLKQAHHQWEQGVACARRGEWKQAAELFRHACKQHPDDALYRLNLARALLRSGQAEEAMAETQRILNGEPNNLLARQFMGECLCTKGRHREAARVMQTLPPSAKPGAEYFQVLGNVLFSAQSYREAVDALMQGLALEVDHALSHYRLGLCFNGLGMKQEAIECFTTCLALGIGDGELACRSLMAMMRRELCQWDLAETDLSEMNRLIDALQPNTGTWSSVFASVTLTDDPVRQLAAARACSNFYASGVRRLPALQDRAMPDRLRIGFVSADFHQHATTILMAELLEMMDRERFEIHLYSHGPDDGSAMRQRIIRAADKFNDVSQVSDADVAKQICSDRIDVLVDLKGHTVNCRLGIFAYRAAPVQVSFLGFPGTTGAHYIDYFIGDRVVSPLSDASYYSEKLALMPVCYQPNDRQRAMPTPVSRREHGLPEGALVLCGFNQPFKLSPEVFDVWCGLLKELPGSVLWLLQWNDQFPDAVRAEAHKRGVDPERLVFAKKLPSAQHIARFALADIYLDSWPCNGHTTVSDALWAGVPVVTYRGATFASRVAASLLNAVGLTDCVSNDIEAYCAQVRRLAGDAQERQRVRQHLAAARDQAPLFDSARYATDFGRLVWRMAERHFQGLPPDHLDAQEDVHAEE